MTTETLTESARFGQPTRGGSVRRIASLARGEALLLRRNPIALLNAVVAPIALLLVVKSSVQTDGSPGLGVGALVVTSLTAFTLMFPVYYNLVTALAGRREELVLKRLRTGETSDAEILVGTAAPAVAIAWGQILIGVLAAITVFDMGMPTNPVLVLTGIVLGTAVFVLLAAASTALTRNVEMAQVTTMPVLLVSMLFSDVMVPLDVLPESLQRLAQVLPLTPVVDLLRLGLTGTTPEGASVGLAASFGAAAIPVLVLAVWVVVGIWATQRWFRWEPRR